MCNAPQCATIKKYGQNQPEARRADQEKLERVLYNRNPKTD